MALSKSETRPLDAKANVLMVGTRVYTTGFVGGMAADSDKGAGVVALTMFDLRRRGKVNRCGMCGVNVGTGPCLFCLMHDCYFDGFVYARPIIPEISNELGTAPCTATTGWHDVSGLCLPNNALNTFISFSG